MKKQKGRRLICFLLAFVMLALPFGGFHAGMAYGSEPAHIGDVLELRLNGVTQEILSPYPNACYEASFITVEGANQYQVLKNGAVLAEDIVDTYPGTKVYVRYFPYREKQVVDSVNNHEQFKMDGAWVGELTKLNFMRGEGEQFKDWFPEEENARLTYVGGGIYQKVFRFTGPLPENLPLEYKIAFDQGWETPTIGGNNNANLQVVIPAGTEEISVWADSIQGKCFTSVEQGGFKGITEMGNLGSRPEGTVNISLIGDFNQSQDEAWQLSQIGKGLYGKYVYLEAGQHSYNCLFDGQYVRSGMQGSVSLPYASMVYFLYDSETNQIFDSVNHGSQIEEMLNFQRPLTMAELDQQAYHGNDLGAVYTPTGTTFKVWAPTASAVNVNLYSTGNAGDNSLIQSHPMMFTGQNGVWAATVPGDLNGVFYTYSVTVGSETNETVDVYAKATGINGDRGMVIQLADTNPEGWAADRYVTRERSTDAIIWEVHVRDFSISADSGVSEANRGKYLAFTERGTTVNGEGKVSTGIDYLSKLGVNYVHLLPVQDFVNNEAAPEYNWGYSTKNYFVPEGSYSSNPADGYTRIREFKQMVQSLHQADIGVVMDVVYNHTAMNEKFWFNLTVPNYYYRLDEHGGFLDRTLCGNETASERLMFRKYMIDSLIYWAQEYHIDGFRFDLMAIHDTETMNAIRRALDQAGLSNVILYGEPWYATDNESELAPGYLASNKDNAAALDDRIAMFNSYTRTGIIGGLDGSATGFVQGGVPAATSPAAEGTKESLMSAIMASSDKNRGTGSSPAWARNPSQSVSYTSCHDDCTLYDWLYNSIYGAPENKNDYGKRDEMLVKMNKLAALINLTNQGMVFFQAGEEFARTKEGDSDSYQSPDRINALRWSRAEQFSDLTEYYQGLIAIRRQVPAFRDETTAAMGTIRQLDGGKDHLIAYAIQNGQAGTEWGTVVVIANAAFQGQDVDLPADLGTGSWAVLADGTRAGTSALDVVYGNRITVPAQTGMILVSTGGQIQVQENEEDLQEQDEQVKTGREKTAEGSRYFDENGNLLTGWVVYDSSSKTAEPFRDTINEEAIYYCDANGYPMTGWQKLWAPEYETEDGLDDSAIMDNEAEMDWYYFKENGRLCRNEKKEIEGELYCFDSQGRRMSGWIYQVTPGEDIYVGVDADTSEDELNTYNQDYSRYLYASPYDGKLSRNKWEYLLYPGKENELNLDDDGRSFYFKNNGYMETGKDTIVKTAITVDELGTYKLRDYSSQLSLLRIDGEWYILDNVKATIGDVLYLTGGSETFPDGFYCFKGENNKMLTGSVMLKEDNQEDSYYYYFSPDSTGGYHKGQGITGVHGGKLYYHGLAVGAQEGYKYELVYLPTLASKQNGATGMFVVDEKGNVQTGSNLESDEGRTFKVKKNDNASEKYGYLVYEVTRDGNDKKVERLLNKDEAFRIYLDDIER